MNYKLRDYELRDYKLRGYKILIKLEGEYLIQTLFFSRNTEGYYNLVIRNLVIRNFYFTFAKLIVLIKNLHFWTIKKLLHL
jgi:hypothetical protein